MRQLFSRLLVPLVGSLMALTATAHATLSEGEAELISKGHALVGYTFSAERQVTINTVAVTLEVHSTVSPHELNEALSALRALRINGKIPFSLKSLSQSNTSTGLVTLNATLRGELSLEQLPTVYRFAQQQTESGRRYQVTSITPYRTVADQQNTLNQLSQNLYQEADRYRQQLPNDGDPPYRIARIRYLTPTLLAAQSSTRRGLPPLMLAAVKQGATPPLTLTQRVKLNAEVTYVQ